MITYIPEIYPDELVYSWFCRYAVYSGNVSNSQVLQDLYRNNHDLPFKEFIGNLNSSARKQISNMYPLETLVLEHTMYPQYARFIPLEQKKNALYKLCYENCDFHHLFSVLPRYENEEFLKYCPLCAKEDREKYGETYWHRKHQLRNLTICSKHKCKLLNSSISAKNRNIFIFYAAEIAVTQTEEKCIIYENNLLSIKFAKYMEQIFESPMNFENSVPVDAVLYSIIKDAKYINQTGSQKYLTKFTTDMTCFYEKMGLNNIASINSMRRTFHGEVYDFSLICQIGFFLNILPEALVNPQFSNQQITDILKQKNEGKIKRNFIADINQYDTDMFHIIESIAKDIYDGTADDMGRPEKVTEKYVCKILGVGRERFKNMPKCKKILEKYSESSPELWARKVIWSYGWLKNNTSETSIFLSQIVKISGVKKTRISMALPYLSKYTSQDVIEDIIAIYEKNYENTK